MEDFVFKNKFYSCKAENENVIFTKEKNYFTNKDKRNIAKWNGTPINNKSYIIPKQFLNNIISEYNNIKIIEEKEITYKLVGEGLLVSPQKDLDYKSIKILVDKNGKMGKWNKNLKGWYFV